MGESDYSVLTVIE